MNTTTVVNPEPCRKFVGEVTRKELDAIYEWQARAKERFLSGIRTALNAEKNPVRYQSKPGPEARFQRYNLVYQNLLETGVTKSEVESAMSSLSQSGLVWSVGSFNTEPSWRIAKEAHDFFMANEG